MSEGRAGYKEARAVRKLKDENSFTFYEIAELINRYTHLSCSTIESIITGSGKMRDLFVKEANKTPALIPFVIQETLKSAYQYEEKTKTVGRNLISRSSIRSKSASNEGKIRSWL